MVLIFLLFAGALLGAPLDCAINVPSAILINADTGCVLFEKEAERPCFPASITKVATALYALKEKGHCLDAILTAEQEAIASISSEKKKKNYSKYPSHWVEIGSTHVAIKRGEKLSFKDLLFATLLASANDATNVVAQYIGEGSIEAFMKNLNDFLKELGCKETHFKNPHGLHHPEHQTSARDMALITREALKNRLIREIVATKNYVCPETNKQPCRTFFQKNYLLKKGDFAYDKAIGVKSGYTSDAGNTLVAAAKDEERCLIAVLLGAEEKKDMYTDALTLFKTAFAEEKVTKHLLSKGVQKYAYSLEGARGPIKAYLPEDLDIAVFPSEADSIKTTIEWNENLKLPVARHAPVAKLLVTQGEDHLIQEVPLYSYSKVKPSLFYMLKKKLPSFTFFAWGFGSLSLLAGTFLWYRKKKIFN